MFTALGEKEKRDFSLRGFFFVEKRKRRNLPISIKPFVFRTIINQSCKHAGNTTIDKEKDY